MHSTGTLEKLAITLGATIPVEQLPGCGRQMTQTTSTTTMQLLQAQADWLQSTNPEKRNLVTLSVNCQGDAHRETACPPSMLAVLVCRNSDLSITSAMLRDPAPQCIILKRAPT
jgi:hypothetical protein